MIDKRNQIDIYHRGPAIYPSLIRIISFVLLMFVFDGNSDVLIRHSDPPPPPPPPFHFSLGFMYGFLHKSALLVDIHAFPFSLYHHDDLSVEEDVTSSTIRLKRSLSWIHPPTPPALICLISYMHDFLFFFFNHPF